MHRDDIIGTQLTLRLPRAKDAKPLYEGYFSDEECSRYLTREPHRRIDQTRDAIRKFISPSALMQKVLFARVIECRSSHQAVGIMIFVPHGQEIEIHYGVCKSRWGQGLASEAVSLATCALLGASRYTRVYSVCAAAHAASRQILKKNGFMLEEYLPQCLRLPAIGASLQDGVRYAKYAGSKAGVGICGE